MRRFTQRYVLALIFNALFTDVLQLIFCIQVLAGTSLLTESRTHFSYGKACVAGETDPVKLKFAIILLDKAAAGFHQLQSLGELAEVLEIQLHIYRYLNDTANVDRLTHQLQSTRQQRAVNRRRIEIDDWITAVKLD